MRKEQATIVLEAAILMPFFLAFMIAMISFVQIALVEMALQSAVTEATKQTAAHIYPIYLLSQTEAGQELQTIINTVQNAKENFKSGKDVLAEYTAMIPDPLISLLSWLDILLDQVENQTNEALNRAILPLLIRYADGNLLMANKIQVLEVQLPSFVNKDHAYFGITASYTLKLFIPFFEKKVTINKTAYERIWIGN